MCILEGEDVSLAAMIQILCLRGHSSDGFNSFVFVEMIRKTQTKYNDLYISTIDIVLAVLSLAVMIQIFLVGELKMFDVVDELMIVNNLKNKMKFVSFRISLIYDDTILRVRSSYYYH